ncbi:transcriptional regulator, TetR family [Burkholderia sp. GAS332]|nr:transcriptional regulator, TetR family [Burkholderia sp. GAS332]
MGVSRQQAVENRHAIVAAAEKLFRERGVDAVGLAELMKAAGFTQGGFYNHFKSKDALVAAVMEKAMEDGGETYASIIENSSPPWIRNPEIDHVDMPSDAHSDIGLVNAL